MIKRYRKTAISQYIIIGLILIALLILGYLSTLLMKNVPFVDHFALPWAAVRTWLLEGENPYDPRIAQVAEDAIAEAGFSGELPEQGILSYPLTNLFFFLPLSLIPYSISRAIWVVILMVCAGLIVHLSLKFSEWKLTNIEKIGFSLMFIFWFPGLYTIITGRLSLILVFLSLLALVLLKSGKFQTAGFILALTASSLPLTFLVIVLAILWSISRKQWSFLIAFISGITFILIVSLLMLPTWPLNWLRTLLGTYQDFTWIRTPLMTLASYLPGIEDFLVIALHAVFGIYLLILWINLFRKNDRVLMWNALAMYVLTFVFYIQYSISELYLLIPALCLVFRYVSDRWGSRGMWAAWIVVVLISVGSWLLVLPKPSFSELVSIPVFTVVLPLFVFLGMIWVRWWAVKLTRLPQI